MAFVQAMNGSKTGVNGADVYTEDGMGDWRVSLFTMLNRDLDTEYIHQYVEKIADLNDHDWIRDLFVMAFQTRDVRGGKGERKLFYEFFNALHHFYPRVCSKMLALIPEYGCWRDMWSLWTLIPELRSHSRDRQDTVHGGFDKGGFGSNFIDLSPRQVASSREVQDVFGHCRPDRCRPLSSRDYRSPSNGSLSQGDQLPEQRSQNRGSQHVRWNMAQDSA